jgi:NADH dehydrogenase
MTIVVVGGGPTGVEVSGTLAEMKKYILPKDYPELDFGRMEIHLIEAGSRLLAGMSPESSSKAENYLKNSASKSPPTPRLAITMETLWISIMVTRYAPKH